MILLLYSTTTKLYLCCINFSTFMCTTRIRFCCVLYNKKIVFSLLVQYQRFWSQSQTTTHTQQQQNLQQKRGQGMHWSRRMSTLVDWRGWQGGQGWGLHTLVGGRVWGCTIVMEDGVGLCDCGGQGLGCARWWWMRIGSHAVVDRGAGLRILKGIERGVRIW